MKRIALLIFLCINPIVLSQTIRHLDLESCIRLALQNSHLLKKSYFREQSSRTDFKIEKTNYLPKANLSVSHDQLFYPPYDYRRQDVLLQLDWVAGAWYVNSAESAKLHLAARQVATQSVKLTVIHQTITRFLAVLQISGQLKMLQARHELLEKHRQLTEALWKSGFRTRLDLLQNETALSENELAIAAAKSEKDKLTIALAGFIGLSDSKTLIINPSDLNSDNLPPVVGGDLQRHPLLQKYHLDISAIRARKATIRASLLPRIELYAGYEVDRDPTAEGDFWQFGGGLQIPLFQWNRSSIQKQKYESDALAAQAEMDHVRRELSIRMESLQREIQKNREMLVIQKQRLKNLKEASGLAAGQYRAGLITNLEFLSLQQQFTEAQIENRQTTIRLIQSVYDYYLLINQPEKIMPGLKDEQP